MNTFETLYSRKSVRQYTGEKPSDEELKAILKSAYAAPVGMGAYDSLCLTVITNKELLEKIDKNCGDVLHIQNRSVLYGAPMLILVSSKLDPVSNNNAAYSNAAIVVHNMVLAAVELGLGSCHIWGAILALNQSGELLQELNLPEGYTPCCAIALGKTDETYEAREIPENRIATQIID